MDVEIITPEGSQFKGESDSVTLPGSKGSFQILNHHTPIISTLESGVLRIHTATHLDTDSLGDKFEVDREKGTVSMKVKCGTIRFKDGKLVILAE